MKSRTRYLILFVLCTSAVVAQDIERVYADTKKTIRENPYDVKGTIGANATFYDANGIANRRDPFYWVVNANLSFTLLNKIQVPFSAIFTQRQNQYSHGIDKYTQPFNQFGISPSYRWLTVHAGFRTLEFSEYSLSGAMFLGGGVEINPQKQKWRSTTFYGRFMKAIPHEGIEGLAVSVPAYQRLGGGTKLRVGTNEQFAEFIFLKIKDRPHSIPFDTALTITPQENQVLAVAAKQKLGEYFRLTGDFAYSMFTRNLYEDPYVLESFSYMNQIYTPRPSSKFNKALNAGLDYSAGSSMFGIKYKRIDPDYKTLGAVFLTNDVEELSLSGSRSFSDNKIGLNAAIGLQRNNLDQVQTLTSRRVISSIGLNFNPVETYNINGTYSNFSSNTLPVRDVFTDTIRFVQLTQNGGLSQTFSFGKKNLRHVFMNMITYQESKATDLDLTKFLNENFSYQISLSNYDLSISTGLVYNHTQNKTFGTNTGLGPQLRIQKFIYRKRLSIALLGGYQEVSNSSVKEGLILNSSLSVQYKISAQQNLRLDGIYTERKPLTTNALSFNETRGSVSYTYNFGLKKKPKTAL